MEIFVIGSALFLGLLSFEKFMQKREFKRAPEKANRYAALPIVYKLACPVVALVCLLISIYIPIYFSKGWLFIPLFLLSIGALLYVEILCVQWYRKNGLL